MQHHVSTKKIEPDTFIGGVGSTVLTKEDLVNHIRTGSSGSSAPIDVSNVVYFNNDGYEISFKINVSHNFSMGADFPNAIYVFVYSDLFNYINRWGERPSIKEIIIGENVIIAEGVNLELTRHSIIKTVVLSDYAPNYMFQNSIFRVLYIPNANPLGSSTSSNETISTWKPQNNNKGFFNIANQTNNGGGIEGDVQNLINKGGTANFIVNSTPPNPITDLSFTVSGVDVILSFTTPASTNSISHYEVYRGKEIMGIISSSGESISGLSNGDEITVYTKDTSYNSSTSNSITISGL